MSCRVPGRRGFELELEISSHSKPDSPADVTSRSLPVSQLTRLSHRATGTVTVTVTQISGRRAACVPLGARRRDGTWPASAAASAHLSATDQCHFQPASDSESLLPYFTFQLSHCGPGRGV